MSECVKALPCYGCVDKIQTMDLQHQLNLNINSLLKASAAMVRVEYVTMNLMVFLLIAGTASARHVPDEQLNTRGINGDDVIERRNNGYISHSPESIPYVNSDFRQSDKVISTKTNQPTNQRFPQSTVKCNEQNHKDSLNNINDYENDYRLRTSVVYAYIVTEYTVQDVNVYTNREDQKFTDNRNPFNQDTIRGRVYQRRSNNVGFIKINEPKLRPENRPAVNDKQDKRRPETSIHIPIQNPQNERTNNIINHPKKSGSVLETVLIQPTPTDEPREEIERFPKTDSDEPIWVWGTKRTSVTTIELGASLSDRSAFTGDQCPTGMVHVHGVCVEIH